MPNAKREKNPSLDALDEKIFERQRLSHVFNKLGKKVAHFYDLLTENINARFNLSLKHETKNLVKSNSYRPKHAFVSCLIFLLDFSVFDFRSLILEISF